jgi:hypothetical protein
MRFTITTIAITPTSSPLYVVLCSLELHEIVVEFHLGQAPIRADPGTNGCIASAKHDCTLGNLRSEAVPLRLLDCFPRQL